MTELNVDFSERELRLVESAGFAASLLEKPDEWLIFLYDALGSTEGSLAEARQQFRATLEAGGRVDCPCCDRPAQIYKRKLAAGIAAVLIAIYREGQRTENGWVPAQYIYTRGWGGASDYAKLRFWGLIEPFDHRTKEENASGLWRVTPFGERFVRSLETIPKWVLIYANKLVGIDDSKRVNIRECLEDKFDYAELMRDSSVKKHEGGLCR
jgi:hypothetical protein